MLYRLQKYGRIVSDAVMNYVRAGHKYLLTIIAKDDTEFTQKFVDALIDISK